MKIYFTPADRRSSPMYIEVDWQGQPRRHAWKVRKVYRMLRKGGCTDLMARWYVYDLMRNVHRTVLSDGTVFNPRNYDEVQADHKMYGGAA